MNIQSLVFAIFLSFAFLCSHLILNLLIDILSEFRKRKIFIPVDEHGIDCVPIWVKSKDYKKIESFYKREV